MKWANQQYAAIIANKELLKEHKVSEDDERTGLDHVQKITDEHVRLIDELQKKKDQELLGH